MKHALRLACLALVLADPAFAHDETPPDPTLDCPRLCMASDRHEWTGFQVSESQADTLTGSGLVWSVWCECRVDDSTTTSRRLRHVLYLPEPHPGVALASGGLLLARLARVRTHRQKVRSSRAPRNRSASA